MKNISKRISIFIGGLSRGGAERVTCNLANYLIEKGHEVEIITMADDMPSYILNDRVKRIILLTDEERKNSFYNLFVRMKRLKKYVKESKTDCYLVLLPITTIMLLMLKKYIKVPVICSERADPARRSKKMQFMLRWACKKADGFVFQTEDARKWYGSLAEDKYNIIIPNAVNSEFLNKQYSVPVREKRIVAVGRLSEQKNFSCLIEAFSLVRNSFPEYKLVIYGEGPLRYQLEEVILARGLEGSVEMPGYISSIADEIFDASLFVLSSNYEGMPNALIEAMALGVPCISTDCPCGGPRFLVRNMENGILVPVGDTQEMARMMEYILSNPERATEMGNKAREIREDLSPERIYSMWEQFLMNAGS